MGVDVDEPGSDDTPVGVDPAIAGGRQVGPDLDDAVTLDGHVGREGGPARPIDDLPTGNDQTAHGTCPLCSAAYRTGSRYDE